MAASETEIANLALSHLGHAKEIANIDTERSAEASACRRFYDQARDEILREFPWPFATRFATLTLVEEDPTSEWAYSYRFPSDCAYFRRILSSTRNDNRQSRVPYKIGSDTTGKLIYTDTAEAECEFTAAIEDPLMYSADFVMALSLRLAAYIAPRVTGGDPFKLGDRSVKLYGISVIKAQSTAVNEQQDEELPESEFVRGRE